MVISSQTDLHFSHYFHCWCSDNKTRQIKVILRGRRPAESSRFNSASSSLSGETANVSGAFQHGHPNTDCWNQMFGEMNVFVLRSGLSSS